MKPVPLPRGYAITAAGGTLFGSGVALAISETLDQQRGKMYGAAAAMTVAGLGLGAWGQRVAARDAAIAERRALAFQKQLAASLRVSSIEHKGASEGATINGLTGEVEAENA